MQALYFAWKLLQSRLEDSHNVGPLSSEQKKGGLCQTCLLSEAKRKLYLSDITLLEVRLDGGNGDQRA